MAREMIEIDGLRQFARSLKAMDSDLPKALRIGFNEAVQIVVDTARPRVPRRTGRAAGSLKAQSTRTAARIAAGGRRAPYFPWLDFGGAGPGNRPARRPFYTDGRYVWKAYAEKRDEVRDRLERALVELAESAGLGVE